MTPATEFSPTLTLIFWSALAVFGVSALIFVLCLNSLLGTHRRGLLSVVWISGSLMVAGGVATLILLLHR